MKRTSLFFVIVITLFALAIIPSARMEVRKTSAPVTKLAHSKVSMTAAPFAPPTVTLTSPVNNAQFIAGATIRLSANAADSDGTISKVEFYQGAVKLGTVTSSPYNFDWLNVPAGNYVLTAIATDNQSQTTTSSAVNIAVLAQVKQLVNWSSITNGTDLGNGSVRKTSTGAWDFSAIALQTLLPGDGFFESTAANFNQSIAVTGANGQGRAVVVGSGGWVGIYEGNTEVAATVGHIPAETITPHGAGDRYRIEITNSILRYIRYRGAVREVMFQSAATLPTYPMTGSLTMSPQNAEWQKTVLAQLTRKATWSAIVNGIDLGNGSVRKTSTGTWDFSATAAQTLARGDGYFESTASYWNHSINATGSDGAGRSLLVGTGGWAAIYEGGVEVASTSPLGNLSAHAAGDRYRLEISGTTFRYVRYRGGIRTVIFTSANAVPAYPISFSLGMSFQNSEWQDTVFAQLSNTVTWSNITNGIDLGNGSVRKTSTGTWDFSASARQQMVSGPGYFESTASYWNHSINLGGIDGAGRSLVAGTGGWAAVYENNVEVASTSPLGNLAAHAAGDRYRLELINGKLRYVRYRSGARTIAFTSTNVIPAYPLGFSLGLSFQNSEWQNTMFSDNVPEHNDATFVSQTVPATMVPGQTYSVIVTMRNTGTSTWTPDGDYQLGSDNLPDNTRWGPSRVNLNATVRPGEDATFSFMVTAPAAGSHSFQWRMVQNGVQRFGALTTNVNVQTVNNPPTVTLTGPSQGATFTAPATVPFTATATDSDGTITKVEFFQGTTKVGEDTTSPYTFNWTNVSAGSYVLSARATDSGGATTNSSTVNITVNPPNQLPTVSLTAPTSGQVFSAPANITLTATAADADGIVTKVQFFRGGTTLIGEDTSAPFSFAWNNVAAGNYSLTAKAFDNAGATTTSAAVPITVNALPSVSLSTPTSGQIFTAPANVTLTATATDSDGSITKVQFFQGTTLLNEDTSSPYSFNWNNVSGNNYSLTAKAFDNLGGTTTSAAIPITVNTLPTVSLTSPTNGQVFTAPANITLSATASDANGTIAKVQFFQGATLLNEDLTAPYSFAWNNVSANNYSLTAKAIDNHGGVTTSAIVSAFVTNAPTTSITSPANNSSFVVGSNITINASASDTDGSVAKVEFFQGAVKLGEDTTSPYSFTWNGVAAGSYSLTTRATDNLGTTGTSAAVNINVIAPSAMARLDPKNRTGGGGEDPLSRNYNWTVPLLNLPGRGLDLGLSLSYNSLVWTKNGNFISFDEDGGFPGPGFRLGFPVIQNQYFNPEVNKNAFLLIMPDGSRVELRQVGATVFYEAADSSHLLLDSSSMVLRTTDGMQLKYVSKVTGFQCTEMKDRNGNFITVNYTSFGRIDTIVDTLGRTVTFNYNVSDNTLTSITQNWAGQPNHVWASFTYVNSEIQTNFNGVTNVGPINGSMVKVLRSVVVNDGASYLFDYTTWGQVSKISKFAAEANHLLNYRSYNLAPNANSQQSDCPRFSERRDWAENWNRGGSLGASGLPAGPEEEVLSSSWTDPAPASWTMPDGTSQSGTVAQVTSVDGSFVKTYFAGQIGTGNGWQRGLVSLVENYGRSKPNDPIIKQKSVATKWTQDDTNVSYPLNPRVDESSTYDYNSLGQIQTRARTRLTYEAIDLGNGMSCHLPSDVFVYQANASTVLRRTHTQYNLNTAYISRRILGLVDEKLLYEIDPITLAETMAAKTEFDYDDLTQSIQGNDAPVQHDTAYNSGFVLGRGNMSSIKRHDVSNSGQFTIKTFKFNTAGAPVLLIDASTHQQSISYADSYSDGNNTRNTLAYPTSFTNEDNFTATATYNFDFGAVTRTQTPAPAGQSVGAIKNFTYDSKARLLKVASQVGTNTDFTHTRFEYPDSLNRVETYITMQAGAGEARTFNVFDGHGRAFATATSHPGSTGGFSGRQVLYDNLGQAIKSSNPTETSATPIGTPTQWAAVGDDASWLYSQQTYDWKGRPLVTTNPDLTTKEASYSGCGCAGGDTITLTDEGTIDAGVSKRRQTKIYRDVLGRTVKTEVLNWLDGSAYATVVNTYNARDQLTEIKEYAGAEGSGTSQVTTLIYDGFGRLRTKHLPEYDLGLVTTYDYNPDDTIQKVTDPRGTTATLSYNNRRLLTGIVYGVPQGSTIPVTAPVAIGYDAAGNRSSMSDAMGTVSYLYNQLLQMTSESRTFTDTTNTSMNNVTRANSYDYNLGGEVSSVTDPWGAVINYGFDATGRISSISGTGYLVSQFVSSMQYRAWNTLKSQTNGNGFTETATYNSRLQLTGFEVRKPSNEIVMSSTNQYYNDGQLKFSDALDERFDRAFSYDHVGRIKEAYSGSAARDFNNGTSGSTPTGPYRQSFQYNAFNQVTQDISFLWSQVAETTNSTFVNNRRSGWTYDQAGRMIADGTTTYQRDAAGRITRRSGEVATSTVIYDGNGQVIKSTLVRPSILGHTQTIRTYYMRATPMGNAVIAEINSFGARSRGYVYAGRRQVAEASPNFVQWKHQDPVSGSGGESLDTGFYSRSEELNAVGVNIGLAAPPPPDPETDTPEPILRGLNLFGGSSCSASNPNCTTCYLDGIESSCGLVMNLAAAGAVQARAENSRGEVIYVDVEVILGVLRVPDGYRNTTSERDGAWVPMNPDDPDSPSIWDPNSTTFIFNINHIQASFISLSVQPLFTQSTPTVDPKVDPKKIEGTGNSSNCNLSVSFESGTNYDSNPNAPNGPGTILYMGQTQFGLGFTVTGYAKGGIGMIGNDTNPQNPGGVWRLEQWTAAYIEKNGTVTKNDAAAWLDISKNIPFKATDNNFTYYDHPGHRPDPVTNSMWGVDRYNNFLIKVYNGKEYCQVEFNFVYRNLGPGYEIHWYRGLRN